MRIEAARRRRDEVDGTGAVLPGSALAQRLDARFDGVRERRIGRPRFEPLDAPALYGIGAVADGRLQKYFGSLNGWPISALPTTLPSRSMKLPLRRRGRMHLRDAGDEQRIDAPR